MRSPHLLCLLATVSWLVWASRAQEADGPGFHNADWGDIGDLHPAAEAPAAEVGGACRAARYAGRCWGRQRGHTERRRDQNLRSLLSLGRSGISAHGRWPVSHLSLALHFLLPCAQHPTACRPAQLWTPAGPPACRHLPETPHLLATSAFRRNLPRSHSAALFTYNRSRTAAYLLVLHNSLPPNHRYLSRA